MQVGTLSTAQNLPGVGEVPPLNGIRSKWNGECSFAFCSCSGNILNLDFADLLSQDQEPMGKHCKFLWRLRGLAGLVRPLMNAESNNDFVGTFYKMLGLHPWDGKSEQVKHSQGRRS